ncbi:conserved hypothetical protein, Tic20-like famil y [Formosa agariphila KMM 3901]|uniref:Chloroplast import component protein (Tic20) n=1 Tax=Formosa agariphila (strain DSM 15362 / KCTC 12365 / LMG 23005 / KMM 3901 / M-2Alg 35-1) TaxID=1347342 RepID=T2KLV8_FORAG|nr:hypothetical protein [Formosa agariphila]CDF79448.1 conserved hypothetical protein, Tic20-like famil y [Formosa agariphila KMM 3901]
MINQTVQEGKTLAIVCYLTFIGLIIAVIMNLEKRNPFTTFHIRQMLGLLIMLLVSNLIEEYLNSWVGTLCWMATAFCWFYAFFHVIKGEAKLVPYVGEHFQEWFKNVR